MAYFVTGATGFIGRRLLQRLLLREGEIHVLVREESLDELAQLTYSLQLTTAQDVEARITPVIGDLRKPLLGVDHTLLGELEGTIEHFFHLAAVYDITAPMERNTAVNVEGTANALLLGSKLQATCFHHVSSIAVAGNYKGVFREDAFDLGQTLPSPYHKTKFEAERIVREQAEIPWRIYRPAVVVGDSKTGEMDKIDGPYYFFKTIQLVSHLLPEWLPLLGLSIGKTNIVPVDWVAGALDAIAHRQGLDHKAFHLADPESIEVAEVFNALARAAHAPHFALSVDSRALTALRGAPSALSLLSKLPPFGQAKALLLRALQIPQEVLAHIDLAPELDTREARKALANSPFERPPAFASYAQRLWDYWEQEMDTGTDANRTLHQAVAHKHVLITGASSGIGRATALRIAAAGGVPLLVARNVDKLEEVRAEIVAGGGAAYVYAADIADIEDVERLVARVLQDHHHVDVLVNNAGRSIRRSVALSYDRFHDYERTMQLNYFGAIKLILSLLPHMRQRREGHIVNVSSIGVQTNPPRFSAYVASKAALDAFTRVVASEVIGDGIHFTTVHMPLVKTPMIAPTKMYNAFPAITPEQAAAMICLGLETRRKHIGTRLGTVGEVAYALSPKAVDRILHLAYRVFPETAAAKGRPGEAPEEQAHASLEQIAMANLIRGVHW